MLDLAILPPVAGSPVPHVVRRGAHYFLAYGVAVVISAAIQQSMGGWEQWQDFPRALLRLLGCAAIAWGLIRRSLWAWWLAVLVGSSWLILGALGVAGFTFGLLYADERIPVVSVASSVVIFTLLAISIANLLRRESRETFRARAG